MIGFGSTKGIGHRDWEQTGNRKYYLFEPYYDTVWQAVIFGEGDMHCSIK